MSDHTIQRALNDCRKRINEAVRERDKWSAKLMRLETEFTNLRKALVHEKLDRYQQFKQAVGLSEAIRFCLRRANHGMTARDVRLDLEKNHFDLDRFANPSAAVANTLKRMAETKTNNQVRFDPTTKTYQLTESPSTLVALSNDSPREEKRRGNSELRGPQAEIRHR